MHQVKINAKNKEEKKTRQETAAVKESPFFPGCYSKLETDKNMIVGSIFWQ